MKKLWHFDFHLSYGQCEGVFAATEEELEAAYGKNIYFGEIEGKHSEVEGPLERSDIDLVSDDPALVENKKLRWGYNPLAILREMEEWRENNN